MEANIYHNIFGAHIYPTSDDLKRPDNCTRDQATEIPAWVQIIEEYIEET